VNNKLQNGLFCDDAFRMKCRHLTHVMLRACDI